MSDFPDTSVSLIEKIKDPSNAVAWAEFETLYRPVIFRIARAKGLQYADAFDLVQQVLQSVAFAIERYKSDPDGPPFRNWLGRVTRNAILKALTRSPQDKATGGTAILEVLSELPECDQETEALLELEYRRELFLRAAEQVRKESKAETWLAFEMSALDNHSIEKTAQSLKLSVGSVYAARSRVVRRIKKAVERLAVENEKLEE